MPSSGVEGWEDRLFEDLSRDERERGSLDAPAVPPALARYEVLERMGEGATAVVWRARDRELGRPVALKVQRGTLALSDVGRQRFRREAQTAAGISHPNVVTVHDAGEEGGKLYLVMELVEGRPLSELLKERGPDPAPLIALLAKAARGVAAAHAKGVVHRDLKPSNILVAASGEPKVADFGLAHLLDSTAQLTKTGSSLGTPLYMAPEQVEGRSGEISPRTDVYSLGAILYEILAGRPPHIGETMMEIYGKILREDPVPPAAAPAIRTVALKALEKDPRRRYASAQEFADDLARFLGGEPVLARPASPAYRAWRKAKRSRLAPLLAVAAAAALLALLAVGYARSGERGRRLSILREHAQTSLEAVLGLRRAGANDRMKEFVPALEAAYRQALETDPDSAEVEQLMGRMHRALMDDARALEFQERALKKNPAYAPALYERAILLANRYGSGLTRAMAQARRLPPGPVTAQASRELPLPGPEEVESEQQELQAVRETILKDCAALQSAPGPIGEAHVLTVKGILAFYRLEFAEARKLLEEAVRKDPGLEEAWAALCETSYRQANVESRRSSDTEAVLRLYLETEGLYENAIGLDAGYAPHWIGRAETRRHRAFYRMSRGQDGFPVFVEAEADLTRALKLAPDFRDAWARRAAVRQMKAVCRMDRGENPVKDLEEAEADLGVLLSRWSGNADAWTQKGHLHNERARWQRKSAANPLEQYAEAEKAFLRALELDPSAVRASQDLGMTLMFRGQWSGSRGIDPLPDFAAAEARFSAMVREARHTADPWEKRAQVRHSRGLYRMGRGGEPLEDFAQAEEDLSEALRVNPANARVWAERGSARRCLGRLQETRDAERARASFAGAVDDFKRAFELNASLEAVYRGERDEAAGRLKR